MKILTATLRAEHLDKGKPRSPVMCPVALAFREVGYSRVRVEYHTIDFTDGENRSWQGRLSKAAFTVVVAVDAQHAKALAKIRAALPMEIRIEAERVGS